MSEIGTVSVADDSNVINAADGKIMWQGEPMVLMSTEDAKESMVLFDLTRKHLRRFIAYALRHTCITINEIRAIHGIKPLSESALLTIPPILAETSSVEWWDFDCAMYAVKTENAKEIVKTVHQRLQEKGVGDE